MISDSESHEILQIEMAAKGCVSGTLDEWPHLKSALRKRGIHLDGSTQSVEIKRICLKWINENITALRNKGYYFSI